MKDREMINFENGTSEDSLGKPRTSSMRTILNQGKKTRRQC
jgi:hypothetical protein